MTRQVQRSIPAARSAQAVDAPAAGETAPSATSTLAPNASGTGVPRRVFLQGVAAGAAGFWVAGRGAWADEAKAATAPADKVRLGIIGVAGRATENLNEEDNAIASQEIVAICDVDANNLGKVGERFPGAAKYADFRKLLERNDLDAVVVSTADHCHAPATLIALATGKHVYCEKPLAHTVEEARRVTEAAAKYKRVTQMGIQIHNTGGNYRRVVEAVRAGAIGTVNHVHVVFPSAKWTGGDLPAGDPPAPTTLNYDLWVGPQPFRPYKKVYHPAGWRSYWHWGTGTLGDMGCHFMDLPFWALNLGRPTKVKSDGPPVHPDGAPEWLVTTWDFPAAGGRAPVQVTWHHGGKTPEGWSTWGLPQGKKTGVVFVGDKGKLFADYNMHKVLGEAGADYKAPPKTLPDPIGHHREWLAAVRKNDPTMANCNFDYSGPLAETVLLGTVAYRAGKELTWDAASLKATNAPEADQFVRQGTYRKGWGMDVLQTL
ncbi:MAG: putative dehydrogenase [Phycisphaerales bacterium]|nr:putative dehydrogenase [Phycisphaerales bacterium]